MARRTRYRQGLAHYSPKGATAARFRKRTGPRPATIEREREERAAHGRYLARLRRVPKPDPHAGPARWHRYLPDTEEVRTFQRFDREENVASGGESHEWEDELRAIALRHWRELYNRQEAERPRRVTPWVRVRAYKRHRPKHWRKG